MVMKIWNKVVYQMTDEGMDIIPDECESFDYDGPIAECFGGGSAPEPPRAGDVANTQTQYNRGSAEYDASMNRINTYTPYGSQEYSVTGTDPRTGAPTYRQDINLSPEAQALFDQRMGQNQQIGDISSEMLGGFNYGKPMDFSDLSGIPGADDLEGFRNSQTDALYGRSTQYMDDQFGRSEDSMRSRLANQGITEGSEAFTNAMKDFNRGKEQAYSGARNDAIAGGGAEASRMFGLGMGARRQGLQEKYAARNQPMQEFNALRGMNQIQDPQFEGMARVGTQPADYAGARQNQYQGDMDIYNARQQQRNNLMGGLFNLGGAAIMASDERVKDDITPVGELNDGTNLYMYTYKGDDTPQVGVMAQEVEKENPNAVVERSGIKHVDYSKVMARALAA